MFEVESAVPAPASVRNKYPFMTMKPGDSFFVPNHMLPPKGPNSLRINCYQAANRAGDNRKYVMRPVDGGYRIWRTS